MGVCWQNLFLNIIVFFVVESIVAYRISFAPFQDSSIVCPQVIYADRDLSEG